MNLKEMREAAGFATQESVEASTGIHQTTVSSLEAGRIRDPRSSTITTLAGAYRHTSDEVLQALAESISAAEALAS